MQFSSSQLQKIESDLKNSEIWLNQIDNEIKQKDFNSTENSNLESTSPENRKSILFFREYLAFQGGHLKVWEYFNHIIYSSNYYPYIYFSKNSIWDNSNPWLNINPKMILTEPLTQPDILFLEGMDWNFLSPQKRDNSSIPILNLIQHIRHGFQGNPRYEFLKHKAIRICVSEQVKEYLAKSGQVNGPIFVIPCGLAELDRLIISEEKTKNIPILIAGFKNPQLGKRLKEILVAQGNQVVLLTKKIDRNEYLEQVKRAKITIFLPNDQEGEGFYLPALEGMALETMVICPDCIGNRNFCIDRYNCFRPDYNLDSIINSIDFALKCPQSILQSMINNAILTTNKYTLKKERELFLEILTNINSLW